MNLDVYTRDLRDGFDPKEVVRGLQVVEILIKFTPESKGMQTYDLQRCLPEH